MKKSPPDIRILPENVANKIAAGEVIERPAAVVKELLENSIDAGATRIDIEFKHGGKTFIKVSDNGCGMTREQALMSLELHATSKIRDTDDIFKISSYGFRGEAVPSIASVSVFSIKTKPDTQSMGTHILVSSGKVESIKDCGMASGTEIVVENLFCSVPARRKFLKTDNVEASHIIKLCRLYALALPHLSITLIENSRIIFRSERNLGMIERVKRIFGAEIAENLILLPECTRKDMKVFGAILAPAESYATSRNICAFINSRPVECKSVFSAIKEAYSSYIPKGRFAAAFLFLDLPPESVDINVHPAKREVRLRDEFGVRDFLLDSISTRLSDFLASRNNFGREYIDKNKDTNYSVKPNTAVLKPVFTPEDFSVKAENPSPKKRPVIESIAVRPAFKESVADLADDILQKSELQTDDLIDDVAAFNRETVNKSQKIDDIRLDGWRYVGFIQRKYILFETKTGLSIVNVSAALRRIHYMRIMASLRGELVKRQLLLIPINLKLDRADAETLADNISTFTSCGFKIEEFGLNFYRVCAAPAWLKFENILGFITDFIHTAREESKTIRRKKLADETFAFVASAKITSAGFVCNETSAVSLLNELLSSQTYATAPDGRPTIKELSNADIAKMFGVQ